MRGERGTACDDGRWRSGRRWPTRVQAPTCGAVRPGQSAPGAPARGAQRPRAHEPISFRAAVQAKHRGVAPPIPGSAAHRAGEGVADDRDPVDRRDRTVSGISDAESLYDDISSRDRYHAECISQRETGGGDEGDPCAPRRSRRALGHAIVSTTPPFTRSSAPVVVGGMSAVFSPEDERKLGRRESCHDRRESKGMEENDEGGCLSRNDDSGKTEQGGVMDDHEVLGRINELAREEHELFERESHGKVTDADRERLRRLEVTLDQCWDLLRQRRARRAAGLNPDEARVRDEKTVAGYTA